MKQNIQKFEKKLDSLITLIIKFDYAEFILQVMMDLKNVFAHQPTFKVLELKNDKGTEYIISWKSNR